MIKFLISIVIILNLFSCKEIKENRITSILNEKDNKLEIVKKSTKTKIQTSDKRENNNDSIFYYLGEPYFIEGVKYIPEENYNYSEVGISSFYGKEMHNTKTVNNDLNKVTELLGRHKTLPIPSMVKITNMENGLSINIKVNDRHNNNAILIEVSRKVAQLLGFYKNQIATVKVEILSDASKQWKNVSLSLNEPEFNKTITSAPTETVSITDIDSSSNTNDKKGLVNDSKPIQLISEQIDEFDLFLRISKFKNYEDIQLVMKNINNDISYDSEKNGQYYDLTLGPLNKSEINKLVSYFISKGYKETKIFIK